MSTDSKPPQPAVWRSAVADCYWPMLPTDRDPEPGWCRFNYSQGVNVSSRSTSFTLSFTQPATARYTTFSLCAPHVRLRGRSNKRPLHVSVQTEHIQAGGVYRAQRFDGSASKGDEARSWTDLKNWLLKADVHEPVVNQQRGRRLGLPPCRHEV